MKKLFFLLVFLVLSIPSSDLAAQEIFFQSVSIFDGEDKRAPTHVLIRDGVIAEIGDDISPKANAELIDGKGKTLLPGLIDAHTHAFFEAHLIQAAEFGVTTELDMMSMVSAAAGFRAGQKDGGAKHRADLFSAGAAVTVAGGHGTQFGFEVPTLAKAEDADAFVEERIKEGSDYIKIIVEDGSAYGFSIPSMQRDAIAAAIKASHEKGKIAVTHVGSAKDAELVVELGTNGLVHLFADELASEDWIAEVKDKGIFIIPTAVISSNASGTNSSSMISEDESLASMIAHQDIAELKKTFPVRPDATGSWDTMKESIARLHKAGVSILAGTDAPNPGTVHGLSMHHELLLLVEAGLSPSEALSAATAAVADAFSLGDRGRIKEGLRADLLLVKGDPTEDITAIHNIEGVWKEGSRVNLDDRKERVAEEKERAANKIAGESRLIDDFEQDMPKAQFGAGWMESTDVMMGGSSVALFEKVEGGANGTAGALEVTGKTQSEQPAFAGIMFSPNAIPMSPQDLSANNGISFWAKGGGETFTVMLFTRKGGMQPSMQQFRASEEWTEFSFDFADFASDGSDVTGFWFGTNSPGEFRFLLDEVLLN